MSWSNIHRTVGSNVQITVDTGYWEETINLLDWSDAANNGKSAYTSPIPISHDKMFTVLVTFSEDVADIDTWIRVEHSIDKTVWHNEAQSGETILSPADLTGGSDVSKLALLDDSDWDWGTIKYYFVYDPEVHGGGRYIRFGYSDDGNDNQSSETIKWQIIPH